MNFHVEFLYPLRNFSFPHEAVYLCINLEFGAIFFSFQDPTEKCIKKTDDPKSQKKIVNLPQNYKMHNRNFKSTLQFFSFKICNASIWNLVYIYHTPF